MTNETEKNAIVAYVVSSPRIDIRERDPEKGIKCLYRPAPLAGNREGPRGTQFLTPAAVPTSGTREFPEDRIEGGRSADLEKGQWIDATVLFRDEGEATRQVKARKANARALIDLARQTILEVQGEDASLDELRGRVAALAEDGGVRHTVLADERSFHRVLVRAANELDADPQVDYTRPAEDYPTPGDEDNGRPFQELGMFDRVQRLKDEFALRQARAEDYRGRQPRV